MSILLSILEDMNEVPITIIYKLTFVPDNLDFITKAIVKNKDISSNDTKALEEEIRKSLANLFQLRSREDLTGTNSMTDLMREYPDFEFWKIEILEAGRFKEPEVISKLKNYLKTTDTGSTRQNRIKTIGGKGYYNIPEFKPEDIKTVGDTHYIKQSKISDYITKYPTLKKRFDDKSNIVLKGEKYIKLK